MTTRRLAPALAAAALLLAACGGASEKELLAQAGTALEKGDRATALIHIKSAIQKNPESGEARYLLGKTLLDNGEPVTAAVELRKARDLNFADAKVLPALARALLLSGEPKKVVEQFAEAKLSDPRAMAELQTTLASALLATQDVEGARAALQAAQKASPGYAPERVLSARLKAGEGDITGALSIIDDLLAQQPREEQALVLKGDLLAADPKTRDGAIAAWRAALEVQPKLIAAHRSVITTLLTSNDLDGAASQLEAMKKAAPNHPETRFLMAQLAFLRKEFTAAREQMEAVLKVRPDDPLALQLAGLVDYQLNSYTSAENQLARALKANPNLLLARETLAQIYLRGAQPQKAVDLLAPVAGAASAPARTLALLGEAYSRAGNKQRADEMFARATKAEPDNTAVRTVAALKQAEQGDDKALADLEQFAKGDASLRTDLAVVRAQLARRNVDGALKAADGIVAKAPDKPIGHLLRGRLLVLKQNPEGARAALEKAHSLDPKYLPAVASLAALDLQAGQKDSARKRLEDLVAADPKSARALLALADVKLRTGASAEDVTATLQQAVKVDAQDARVRVALVNHLLSRGDHKAALTAARDGSAALPASLELMDALGLAQLRSGDTQQAVSTFKKLAALQTTSPLPLMRLGDAYIAARDTDSASASFRRALEIKADLLPAQRALAEIAIAGRRPQDALTIARNVQKQRPAEAAGFVIEGDAEASRRNWDAALAAYRNGLAKGKATDIAGKVYRVLIEGGQAAEAERFAAGWMTEHPKDGGFLFLRGDIAIAKGQMAEAEAHYRSVLKLLPEHGLSHNNIAWLMVKQNKPGALVHAEKAVALLPDQPAVMDTLALALLAEGQAAKALEVQKRAVERAPESPTLRLTLARCYLKAGDKAQARTELDKLARLGEKFPQHAEVTELLKSV